MSSTPKNILIVNDDTGVNDFFKTLFEHVITSYNLVLATDLEDAEDKLKEGELLLTLLDVGMTRKQDYKIDKGIIEKFRNLCGEDSTFCLISQTDSTLVRAELKPLYDNESDIPNSIDTMDLTSVLENLIRLAEEKQSEGIPPEDYLPII